MTLTGKHRDRHWWKGNFLTKVIKHHNAKGSASTAAAYKSLVYPDQQTRGNVSETVQDTVTGRKRRKRRRRRGREGGSLQGQWRSRSEMWMKS